MPERSHPFARLIGVFQRRDREPSLEKTAAYINGRFRKGQPAHRLKEEIRKFPQPIIVDFNGVLVDNLDPLEVNPLAASFIQELKDLGTIFLMTTAQDWDSVHSFLTGNSLWYPGMILMTQPNWSFLTDREPGSKEGQQMRDQFVSTSSGLGQPTTNEYLLAPPAYKRVAPLFNKPWLVPLIDDSLIATKGNPGILGISVEEWRPKFAGFNTEHYEGSNLLSAAVQQVRNHYAGSAISTKIA